MNRKQFIILLVLVVIVGVAGLLVRQRSHDSWESNSGAIGQKLLPNLAVNEIAQITIKSGTAELNLAKRDNLWRVHERGDYPANFSQISDLLVKFADLKVAQTEDIGPSQLARFELLPPGNGSASGTLLEMKDQAGKTVDSVLLGKKHMKKIAGNSQLGGMGDEGWPDGRYAMTGSDTRKLAVVSDPLDNVQTGPESWLNKEFLSIERPCVIAMQFPEATNSWKLSRASETNDWALADAKADEKLDVSKISSVTSPFNSASFNDVAPLKDGDTNQTTVLTVQTFDGFTYVVKIGKEAGGNYPVSFAVTANIASGRNPGKAETPDDKARLEKEFKEQQDKLKAKLDREAAYNNWVYQLPSYMVDPLLKSRSQLVIEFKKDEPAKSDK